VEIPTTDPDDRRGWAEKLVKEQSKPWNGHVTLTGEEVNVFSDNSKKRLPVTFESVAVFGLGDPYDNIVIIHPSSVAAGSPGQKIDAGNYYINQGTDKADTNVVAAGRPRNRGGDRGYCRDRAERMVGRRPAGSGAPAPVPRADCLGLADRPLQSLPGRRKPPPQPEKTLPVASFHRR
jgi:hypothetical protein